MSSNQNPITPRRGRATRYSMVLLVSCALAFCPRVRAQQARGPFSAAEIIGLIKSGVTAERVESLARQYGIAFQVTAEVQAQLREAGAPQELLSRLQQLAPHPASKPAPPPEADVVVGGPAGAEIFIDGKLAGVTSPQGQLTVPHLAAGEHSLHVVAAGYAAYDGKLTTKPGVPLAFSVTPQKLESPPFSSFRVRLKGGLIGSSIGVLTIGKGRIQFAGNKGHGSFDYPLSDIEQYGTVRVGADFYVTMRKGGKAHKNYYFYGPASNVLHALAQAVKH